MNESGQRDAEHHDLATIRELQPRTLTIVNNARPWSNLPRHLGTADGPGKSASLLARSDAAFARRRFDPPVAPAAGSSVRLLAHRLTHRRLCGYWFTASPTYFTTLVIERTPVGRALRTFLALPRRFDPPGQSAPSAYFNQNRVVLTSGTIGSEIFCGTFSGAKEH